MVIYLCDEMLQKMARWLRIAGYNVISPKGQTDRELARMAADEGRVLLTRDRDLSNMKGIESLLIRSDDLETQMREVFDRYPPGGNPPGKSRCPLCNGELISFKKTDLPDEIIIEIPPMVYENHVLFLWCSGCAKPFWFGSHWKGIGSILGSYGLNPKDLFIPP